MFMRGGAVDSNRSFACTLSHHPLCNAFGLFFSSVSRFPFFSAAAVSAPNNDPIVVLNNLGPQGVNVVQGASCASTPCMVGLTWTPAASGLFTGYVSIADTVTNVGVSLNLTGGSGTPAVSLSPGSVMFPAQSVGTSATAQTVTLTNTGTQSMQIGSMTLIGTNAADYGLAENCPAVLGINSQCVLTVSFTPSAAGARMAAIQLITNAPTSPNLIQLTGTGQ
jgi:hypothetical protein